MGEAALTQAAEPESPEAAPINDLSMLKIWDHGLGLQPVPIDYVPQTQTWDCGLACVAMALSAVLPAGAMGTAAPPLSSLYSLCPTTSVWTIDLAYLLRMHGAHVLFTTTCVGANPDYQTELFYSANMSEDVARVDSLFARAVENSIWVERMSVSSEQLRGAVLSGRFLVLALVDKTKLGAVSSSFQKAGASYTGHYLLLHGYENGEYCVRDPAAGDTTRLSETGLEAARRAYGTDEDLLFIRLPAAAAGTQENQSHCDNSVPINFPAGTTKL